jgi:hypothetical protein
VLRQAKKNPGPFADAGCANHRSSARVPNAQCAARIFAVPTVRIKIPLRRLGAQATVRMSDISEAGSPFSRLEFGPYHSGSDTLWSVSLCDQKNALVPSIMHHDCSHYLTRRNSDIRSGRHAEPAKK